MQGGTLGAAWDGLARMGGPQATVLMLLGIGVATFMTMRFTAWLVVRTGEPAAARAAALLTTTAIVWLAARWALGVLHAPVWLAWWVQAAGLTVLAGGCVLALAVNIPVPRRRRGRPVAPRLTDEPARG